MDTLINTIKERHQILERLIERHCISDLELSETEVARADELVEMKLATKEMGIYYYGVPNISEIKKTT